MTREEFAIGAVTSKAEMESLSDVLETIRKFLDMDIAFVTSTNEAYLGQERLALTGQLRAAPLDPALKQADRFCGQIIKGNLPAMISDTRSIAIPTETSINDARNIRAVVHMPLYDNQGNQNGNLCAFSLKPKPGLHQCDLTVVSMLGRLASGSLTRHNLAASSRQNATNDIQKIIADDLFEIYLQPIVSLSSNRTMALEALSRFNTGQSYDTPTWFEMASTADLSVELELAAIIKAIRFVPDLPNGMYITLNASPETVCTPTFLDIMQKIEKDRVVIELTEHTAISDPDALQIALDKLRKRRIGVAIDDVGAGYAGLSTLLGLNPDVLKLDRGLVCNIHNDPAKQALTKAMVHFAQETDSFLIAEGVEHAQEHWMLRQLGVRLGQGYLYGRPEPANETLIRLQLERSNPENRETVEDDLGQTQLCTPRRA